MKTICDQCNKEKEGAQEGICNHCGKFPEETVGEAEADLKKYLALVAKEAVQQMELEQRDKRLKFMEEIVTDLHLKIFNLEVKLEKLE